MVSCFSVTFLLSANCWWVGCDSKWYVFYCLVQDLQLHYNRVFNMFDIQMLGRIPLKFLLSFYPRIIFGTSKGRAHSMLVRKSFVWFMYVLTILRYSNRIFDITNGRERHLLALYIFESISLTYSYIEVGWSLSLYIYLSFPAEMIVLGVHSKYWSSYVKF